MQGGKEIELNKIYNENCLTGMKKIQEKSIDCCVTSPPYWGLRDYELSPTYWPKLDYSPMPGIKDLSIDEWTGCLGLEPTIEMFVGHIVLVFRELHRIIKDSGTVWLNFGDSYIGTGGNRDKPVKNTLFNNVQAHNPSINRYYRISNAKKGGLKPKDLSGIPWRVAFALQADGWYLRSDVIWHKLSCMPEAVKDRPTKAHEYLFLLAKSPKYYYDYKAIKEECVTNDKTAPRGSLGVIGNVNSGRRKGNSKTFRGGGAYTKGQSYYNHEDTERESHGNIPNETGLRNKRTVWSIGPQPFKAAHFATFPPKLIEPCILASCPVNGVVIDPFMGSGTVAEKSIELQRNFIGFEMNAKYICLSETERLKSIQIKIV